MAGAVGLAFDQACLRHDPGPYRLRASGELYPFGEPVTDPSGPEVTARTWELLNHAGLVADMVRLPVAPANDAALLAVHTADHVQRVAAISRDGGGYTGQAARIGAGGDHVARLAAGGALAALEWIASGQGTRALSLMRPAGHHASADRGLGDCIFNNVAVAVQRARASGRQRVMVVDIDVHHGNGTQAAFYSDADVLFVSLHQEELFPQGWGGLDQAGAGDGFGYTVNVPLPAGTGDAGYIAALERLVLPLGHQFRPALLVVSAGVDACNADPLGRMCVTTDGFRALTARLMALADAVSGGRLLLVAGGGHADWYAPYCWLAIVETLLGARCGLEEPFPPEWVATMPPTREVSPAAWAALERCQVALADWWDV